MSCFRVGIGAIAPSTRRGSVHGSPISASDDPVDLDAALAAWHRVATREWAYETWLAVESLQPLRLRLEAVQKRLAARGRRISLDDTWKLVNAPVDEDGLELLSTFALALAGDRVARPHLSFLLDAARLRGAVARRRGAGGTGGEHPSLVRASVPGSGRRDHRARCGTGGGRGRARRRTAPGRDRVTDDRTLPFVRAYMPSVVPAL